VEAAVDDHLVAIGAGKPRALLAMLALSEGSPVSSEALIDGLWGETPTATAPKMMQVYVSQLRKVLGGSGNGAEIVTRGRAGLAARALALWRGPPLDEVVSEPFGPARDPLEAVRLAALDLAIESHRTRPRPRATPVAKPSRRPRPRTESTTIAGRVARVRGGRVTGPLGRRGRSRAREGTAPTRCA
jgi:hypothetical protein